MKTDVVRNWDFGPKNEARNLALSVTSRTRKPVKTALFFPSDTCLDLIQSLKRGLITRKTYLILVEKEETVIIEIKRFLRKMGFKNYYIHDHKAGIHKLNLTTALQGRKLDFMFFDICGNLTPEIAYWFYNNQSNFNKNMMMPTTLAIHPRGIRAKTRGPKKENGRLCKFFHVVEKETQDIMYDASIFGKKDNLASSNAESLYLLRDFRLSCKALFHMFSTKNISIEETLIYRDTSTNMAMFNIRIIGDKTADNTFESIITAYDKKVCRAKMLRKVRLERTKRRKKTNNTPRVVLVEMAEIAKYKTYENVPSHIKAKITKQANLNKASIKMTHAGYKARLTKLTNRAA